MLAAMRTTADPIGVSLEGLRDLPGLISRIGSAMSDGTVSDERVALIQLEFDGADTTQSAPSEAERLDVLQCLKEHIRANDTVTRLDKGAFVALIRLRPAAVTPSIIESRLVNAIHEYTGDRSAESLRSLLLVVDPTVTRSTEDFEPRTSRATSATAGVGVRRHLSEPTAS